GGFGGGMPPGQGPILRKLDVGDVLQTSAKVIGSNFPAFVVIASLFALPGTVLGGIAAAIQVDRQQQVQQAMAGGDFSAIFDTFSPGWIVVNLAIGLLAFVLTYLGMGTLMYASAEHLAGRQPGVADVVSKGLRVAPSVALVAILIALSEFAAALPGSIAMGVGMFAVASAGEGGLFCCLGPFGIAVILVPLVYVIILFFLSIPAAVVERLGPIAAMQRSIELTRGQRGMIFLVLLLVFLVFFLILFVGSCCIGAGAGAIDPATMQVQGPSTFMVIINQLLGFIFAVARIMVVAALAAVMYARIRGIKDGVDASAIADVFR
ncbi:MAG: hypothetical protein AAF938_25525, partial [Myxococcota bacterium]